MKFFALIWLVLLAAVCFVSGSTLRTVFATASAPEKQFQKDDENFVESDATRLTQGVFDLNSISPTLDELPAFARPIEIERPQLPDDLQKKVESLGSRMAQLRQKGLSSHDITQQNESLDEAIRIAERIVQIRQEHQGNLPDNIRWRDAKGQPSEWFEVLNARQHADHLRRLSALSSQERAEFTSLGIRDNRIELLYASAKFSEAEALAT